MCRLYAVHAPANFAFDVALVDSPTSLANQSRRDREGENHLSGWGFGWYDENGPRVVRSTAPACADPQFVDAARSLRARIAMAHVRDASVGSVREENCHPFAFGPWLFCHNGTLEGFDRLRPSFERDTSPALQAVRRGDTDSEYLFHWILSNVQREGYALAPSGDDAAQRIDVDGLYGVVRESLRRLVGWSAAAEVAAPTGLNIVLTDGRILLAVRYGRTLWTQSLTSPAGAPPALVIASEPTDERGPWREVEERSILTSDASGRVEIRPL